ncbi:MAG: type II toxin-antitoxin system Phd/YefM family antitoxin [Deltaproteobacteria bacterium]|nr:MAG: type II toxin-antitoxin system Phd/YefM family antitoxin [Deltaproteobacteria bacterium]
MKSITVRETRQGLSRLEELLADGEVTITRRGKPVARLLPIGGRRPIPSHKDLRECTPRLRRGSERLQREERDAR